MSKIHDIFISYSSIDRIYAEKLAHDLRAWGVSVWWDEWEIKVGDSLTTKIQQALTSSSWLAVVLTPNSVNSSWVEKELAAALSREFETRRVVVLPLLFRDCELPAFLYDKKRADFRSSYDAGFKQLLTAIQPPIRPEIVNKLLTEDKIKILAAYTRLADEDKVLYTDHLLDRLSSKSALERRASIYALWALENDLLPVAILQGLRDHSMSVRRQAIFLAGETRNAFYGATVAGLMSDGHPDIRHAARQAYAKINA